MTFLFSNVWFVTYIITIKFSPILVDAVAQKGNVNAPRFPSPDVTFLIIVSLYFE